MQTIQGLAGKEFIIPIYQRNYSWTNVEIDQLIDDIKNSPNEKYHIGSLVLFNKGNNLYEVTDGQQRLTTVALILLALKVTTINLRFEARQENNNVLKELIGNYESAIKKEDNELVYALKQYIEPKLKQIEPDMPRELFKNKLLSSVILNENILPHDINLHHYFERMNSRGKQLELHSVLRAKFLKDVDDKAKFKKWDECAKLEQYSNFAKVSEDELNECASLLSILNNPVFNSDSKSNTTENDKDYGSVVNFPTFLLIALKIFNNELKIVSLNEELLLKEFGYYEEEFVINSDSFLVKLIELKKLFDKFIVKRSYKDFESYWVIKNVDIDKNTFSKDDISTDDDNDTTLAKTIQQKLIKIQSMLHSAYPSNKEWLYEILKFIWWRKDNIDIEMTKFGEELLGFIEKFAFAKFNDHVSNDGLPKEKGLCIPRVVFYYTDYLLWRSYYENVRGNNSQDFSTFPNEDILRKISKNKALFNSFNFRSFSSIEHLYPQNPASNKYIADVLLNSFGNLCLISRSSNSRYSNLEPISKREHSRNNGLNESLKQAIMFTSFNENEWGKIEIENHEKEIKTLITHYTQID